MKNKKLLVVGGGVIHTYNIIELIKGYFDDIFLITNVQDDKFKDIKHEVLTFSFSNPLNPFLLPHKINKIIRDYKPDFIVIIQVDTAAFSTVIANRKKIPTLVIALGSDVLTIPNKGYLYKQMAKFVLKRVKYFNTGARYAVNKMNELSGKDLDVVIANSGFEPGCKPMPKQNIIYSNRLHQSLYRIPQIIEAFARFIGNKERDDWMLVIGATGDEDNLKQKAKELGIEDKVEFIGWVEKQENNYYYSISKIWISIPESDCTPISLMEAMAAGCIPIMSDLDANKEWVEEGKNGIIVSDYNSNYIERALNLDYDFLLDYNLKLMEKEGTKEANRKKFYSIFDKEFKD
ncbi:MAG: glycosyltransferase family 4 protein [Bacteroidales bacterium]